jgi:hypothetical protein
MYYYVRLRKVKAKMRHIVFIFILFIGFVSCKKAVDTPGAQYAGQEQPYCNDPEAINYNYQFPGTANNMTCTFPTDPFTGQFTLSDTVYTADFASYYVLFHTVNVYAISKTKMAVVGFCGISDSIKLTAGRYYKASIDTTILNGQALCNPKDTISGFFEADSIGIKIKFTMNSEIEGIKYHTGRGIRIQ